MLLRLWPQNSASLESTDTPKNETEVPKQLSHTRPILRNEQGLGASSAWQEVKEQQRQAWIQGASLVNHWRWAQLPGAAPESAAGSTWRDVSRLACGQGQTVGTT